MKLSSKVRPISYLKSNAAEIARNLKSEHEPLIITQNGEAKIVVQDIESYEKTQETLAMLKILSLGRKQIDGKNIISASEVFNKLIGD